MSGNTDEESTTVSPNETEEPSPRPEVETGALLNSAIPAASQKVQKNLIALRNDAVPAANTLVVIDRSHTVRLETVAANLPVDIRLYVEKKRREAAESYCDAYAQVLEYMKEKL